MSKSLIKYNSNFALHDDKRTCHKNDEFTPNTTCAVGELQITSHGIDLIYIKSANSNYGYGTLMHSRPAAWNLPDDNFNEIIIIPNLEMLYFANVKQELSFVEDYSDSVELKPQFDIYEYNKISFLTEIKNHHDELEIHLTHEKMEIALHL